MRAVLYLRMSRDAQDKSIGEQRAALQSFAKRQGYSIVGEYADEGISGDATEKRLAFQRMIADCTGKTFECVLAWDQDRFGRFDPLEAGYWVKPMRDAGVWLETIAQGRIDWNDFASRLVWTVSQEAKHAFLRDIARNSLRGNIAKVRQGKSVGRVPFGYVRDTEGRYTPGDAAKVAAVRRAFELRCERVGYLGIAKRLNAEGFEGPTGKWAAHSVRTVLTREIYTGTLVYGRTNRGKYQTMIDGQQEAPTGKRGTPIRIVDAHEPLIDLATWDTVEAIRLDAPKAHARGDGDGAPLSGFLFCGDCGGIMFSQSLQRTSGRRYPQYICSTYHRGRGCGCKVVKQDQIHAAVFDLIRQRIIGDSYAELLASIKRQNEGRKPRESSTAISRNIAKLEGQIASATDRLLICDARLVPELERRIFAMADELTALKSQIMAAPSQPSLTVNQIADSIWSVPTAIDTGSNSSIRANLKALVKRIDLSFTEGRQTKRGQGFICTGGKLVMLDSKELCFPWTTQRHWTFSLRKAS